MRAKHPGEFRQDWVSYAGTGRNIFGAAMLSGHGRPGPIVLLKLDAIAVYCRTASDTEKRQLYDVLVGGDEAKIRELVGMVIEAGRPPDNTEPDRPESGSEVLASGTNRTAEAAGLAR